jgi:hypothetical protein
VDLRRAAAVLEVVTEAADELEGSFGVVVVVGAAPYFLGMPGDVYLTDREFGFMHVRSQGWIPYDRQVYINGPRVVVHAHVFSA